MKLTLVREKPGKGWDRYEEQNPPEGSNPHKLYLRRDVIDGLDTPEELIVTIDTPKKK